MNWIKPKIILTLIISIMLSLFFAEVFIRYLKPQRTYSEMLKLVGSYYAPDDKITFTIQKNYSGFEPTMDGRGNTVITTNSEGFRATKEPTTDKLSNILVIGDSYTFGVYVNDDETYPSIIEKSLDLEANFRVINAGYTSGHETDQQYAWFQQNFEKLKPKVVVWGVFLGNDILGINETYWKDMNSSKLPLEYVNNKIYVNDIGQIRAKEYNPMNSVNTKSYYKVPLLRELHIWIAANKGVNKLRNMFSSSPLNNKKPSGYLASKLNLNHIYGIYSDEFLQKEELFLKLLKSAEKTCKENECNFVVALHPINFMVHPYLMEKVIPGHNFSGLKPIYYSRLASKLESMKIHHINIHEHMIEKSEKFFPENGEVHYNLTGNKFAGELIANYLKSNFASSITSEH